MVTSRSFAGKENYRRKTTDLGRRPPYNFFFLFLIYIINLKIVWNKSSNFFFGLDRIVQTSNTLTSESKNRN